MIIIFAKDTLLIYYIKLHAITIIDINTCICKYLLILTTIIFYKIIILITLITNIII